MLQWSRGPKTPDTSPDRMRLATSSRLQWSRGPKTPDTPLEQEGSTLVGGASMEPGSEDPGYPPTPNRPAPPR